MQTKHRVLVVVLAILAIAVGVRAQQQTSGSGGSSVSIMSGINQLLVDAAGKIAISNTSFGISGSLPAGSNTIGTVGLSSGSTVALGTGSSAIGSITNTSFGVTGALPAGTNTIGKTAPLSTCGTTAFSQAFAAVPTTATSLTASTTCVQAIVFSNTTSSAQTVTVTDGQATAVTVVATYSIPANSQTTFPFAGAPMTSGIKWQAGASGVVGAVVGWQ